MRRRALAVAEPGARRRDVLLARRLSVLSVSARPVGRRGCARVGRDRGVGSARGVRVLRRGSAPGGARKAQDPRGKALVRVREREGRVEVREDAVDGGVQELAAVEARGGSREPRDGLDARRGDRLGVVRVVRDDRVDAGGDEDVAPRVRHVGARAGVAHELRERPRVPRARRGQREHRGVVPLGQGFGPGEREHLGDAPRAHGAHTARAEDAPLAVAAAHVQRGVHGCAGGGRAGGFENESHEKAPSRCCPSRDAAAAVFSAVFPAPQSAPRTQLEPRSPLWSIPGRVGTAATDVGGRPRAPRASAVHG